MSTPIETNTEELQKILQTVYNLPMAGGGSAEPDLTIRAGENFMIDNWEGVGQVEFDPNEVVSTFEKLQAGKDVRAVLIGRMYLNDYTPAKFMATYPSVRVLAYDPEVYNQSGCNFLVVRFYVAHSYKFNSADDGYVSIEYRFSEDPKTGRVVLDTWSVWTEQ